MKECLIDNSKVFLSNEVLVTGDDFPKQTTNRTFFCGRLADSWHYRVSLTVRYEIACLVSIIGLIVTLLSAFAVYSTFKETAFSYGFINGCNGLGLSPIATAIVALVLSCAVLLLGLMLFPKIKDLK